MSESAQYTALELEVKGNKNSSGFETLNDLTKALQRLKSVQPANVKALAESVKLLTDTAGALSAKDIVRLNDLSFALKRIASLGKMNTNAPKVIQDVADAANRLSNETIDKLTKLGEAFEKISQLNGTKVKTALNAMEPALQNPEDKYPNTPTNIPGSEQEVEPAEIGEVGDAAESTSKKLLTLGQALIATKRAFNDTMKAVKFFGNTFFGTLKTIGSVVKQALFSKLESRLNAIHSVLRRIGRIAFLKTIRGAISAVVSAVKTGIDNLYQWSLLVDHTFANSMNQIATASMYMKNSIGAMLAPAIEALAPVIDFVIDKFVALLNVMNQVLALITGKQYWTKAVKQPQQFADAANSAGSAASDAAKAIKLYLGAFDELHVMDSPSGSGSGGGGGSGSGSDYGGMFENVAFDTTLQDAINNGDWFRVGEALAEKLNDVTLKADEWITNTFTPWANTFAKNLGDTINGFVKTYNWAQLGTTVGNGVNGIVNALNTFYTTTEWQTLGKQIGTAITNLFSTIKWTDIATMVGNKMNSVIDTLYGLVKEIFKGDNATKIGQTIADSVVRWFQTVHWDNVAETFETGFNGAVQSFKTFVSDPNVWTEFKKALKAFETMDLDIAGLGSALSTVFTNALGTINWFGFGKAVGEFIGSIEWEKVVPSILTAISETLSGFINGVWNSGSGKTLIGLIAASFATALAFEIGVEIVKANILKTVITSAITGAGAGAAGVTAGTLGAGEATTTIWTAIAEAIGGSVTATGVMIAVPLLATLAISMSFTYDNPDTPVNAEKLKEAFVEKYGDETEYIRQHGVEAYESKMKELAQQMVVDGAFKTLDDATKLAGRKMGSNLNQGLLDAGFNVDGVVQKYNTSTTNALNQNKTGDVTKQTGITIGQWLMSAFGWNTDDKNAVIGWKTKAEQSQVNQGLPNVGKTTRDSIRNNLNAAFKWLGKTFVQGWGTSAEQSQKNQGLGKVGLTTRDAIQTNLSMSFLWSSKDKNAVIGFRDCAEQSQKNQGMDKVGITTAKQIKSNLRGSFTYSSDGDIKTWTKDADSSLDKYNTGGVANDVMTSIIKTLKSPFDYSAQNYSTTIQSWITEVAKKLKNCLTGTNLGTATVEIQYKETKKPTGQLQVAPQAGGGVYYNGKWHNVQAFANGGQPSGELFLAREAGPELVGTIGGHTAVMNNNQIVSSVSDGVYKAMTAAMSSGNGNTHVHLYIDGKEVYDSVVNQNNQIYKRTGNSPLMV